MTDRTSNASESDRTAEFVRLLRQHDRQLVAFVHAMVPEWNTAEDLVQDASVRLWEQFDNYEPGTNFGAWACTIARYLVLDSRKQSKKSHLYFRDEVLDALASEVDALSEDVSERMQAMRLCIDDLSPENRALLLQYYSGDAQITDIAADAGRSVGALYTAVSRSRRRVHDCVEQRLREQNRP